MKLNIRIENKWCDLPAFVEVGSSSVLDQETALVTLEGLGGDRDPRRARYLNQGPNCSSGKHTRIKIKPIKIVKTIYIYISYLATVLALDSVIDVEILVNINHFKCKFRHMEQKIRHTRNAKSWGNLHLT